MKLKEFLEQNNEELIAEVRRCKTIEEIEAFAKANKVEFTKEELEEISEILQEKDVLLSDDELDKAAGGATTASNGSKYGTAACPGPDRSSIVVCLDCTESGPLHMNRNGKPCFCYHK